MSPPRSGGRAELTELIETHPGAERQAVLCGHADRRLRRLDYLAAEMTTERIVADFPELSEQHVRAAIEFAALCERRLATLV